MILLIEMWLKKVRKLERNNVDAVRCNIDTSLSFLQFSIIKDNKECIRKLGDEENEKYLNNGNRQSRENYIK